MTDATNKDPLHYYISPQINEQQGSKTSTQYSQGMKCSKVWGHIEIITEYHKTIVRGKEFVLS